MQLSELRKQLGEEGEKVFHGNCHDCGVAVDLICNTVKNGELIISGGAVYNPKLGTPPVEQTFFKCDSCFKKDKILQNFVPCEVYSRVVGYLRPVQQWNKGKLEEYKQRTEFVVDKHLGYPYRIKK